MPIKPPIVSIFHNPSSKGCKHALHILQHNHYASKYRVDVVQSKLIPPTAQQISNMIEYLSQGKDISKGIQAIVVPHANQLAAGRNAAKEANMKSCQKLLGGKKMTIKDIASEAYDKAPPLPSTIADVQAIIANYPDLMTKPIVVDWINERAIVANPPEDTYMIAKHVDVPAEVDVMTKSAKRDLFREVVSKRAVVRNKLLFRTKVEGREASAKVYREMMDAVGLESLNPRKYSDSGPATTTTTTTTTTTINKGKKRPRTLNDATKY
ncbi:hypothetical protein BGW38_002174 [Lunasporangiospora selenospora]|uniref:Uncharacterized protein n=1 Tax=Lunasporangiospora selenospora TaxID=979761 RepID=A0A9P6G1Q8_9FUNG|nr:hypothetical protein BGW38_002174 [Lunasporangiospora selenospora]